jgi:hypothetical protein
MSTLGQNAAARIIVAIPPYWPLLPRDRDWVLDLPGTCTTRTHAPVKHVQIRENLQILNLNNFIL